MGMSRMVRFEHGEALYEDVARLLAERGLAVRMRMIDGELAFPDETPPPHWQELRVGAKGAMVTLRRASGEIEVITWGSADAAATTLWNAMAWACAAAAGGRVATDAGELDADAFAQHVDLSEHFD